MNSTIAEPEYDEVLGGTLVINSRVVAEIGKNAKDAAPASRERMIEKVGENGDDATPLLIGRDPSCHVVLDDQKVSAVHLELTRTTRGVRVRDRSRNGVVISGDVFKFQGETYLRGRSVLKCGSTKIDFFAAETTTRIAKASSEATPPLVGESPEMRPVFALIRKVAPLEFTTLITGETGTGKELVARAIHLASPRARRPFLALNCGAIPESLAESVLFGHKRGAFTGAIEHGISPFLAADGGTVFLDEIGELPPTVQTNLLRVLAEREVTAVGSNEAQSFNVRVLAATRRELDLQIGEDHRDDREKTFRSDLFFRIAQVRVELPPLRRRPTDIRVLTSTSHASWK